MSSNRTIQVHIDGNLVGSYNHAQTCINHMPQGSAEHIAAERTVDAIFERMMTIIRKQIRDAL